MLVGALCLLFLRVSSKAPGGEGWGQCRGVWAWGRMGWNAGSRTPWRDHAQMAPISQMKEMETQRARQQSPGSIQMGCLKSPALGSVRREGQEPVGRSWGQDLGSLGKDPWPSICPPLLSEATLPAQAAHPFRHRFCPVKLSRASRQVLFWPTWSTLSSLLCRVGVQPTKAKQGSPNPGEGHNYQPTWFRPGSGFQVWVEPGGGVSEGPAGFAGRTVARGGLGSSPLIGPAGPHPHPLQSGSGPVRGSAPRAARREQVRTKTNRRRSSPPSLWLPCTCPSPHSQETSSLQNAPLVLAPGSPG